MAIRSIGAKNAPEQNNTDHLSQSWGSSAIERPKRSNTVRRMLIVGVLGFSLPALTGCTLGSGACKTLAKCECVDNFMIGYRNRAMAEKAWHCLKESFCIDRHAGEFKAGFIQGYSDVASGGNGCTPAMAPSSYSGWRYQTAGGHAAVNSWFQGYPQGVKAAEQDGVGNWQSIQMNSRHRQPTPVPIAGTAPAMDSYEDDDPDIANPFYPNQELVPVPDPEMLEETDQLDLDLNDAVPGDIEHIEIPGSPDDADSVFDGLFPPVAVDDSTASADAFIAERDESSQYDDDDDSLPFSFE